jgi:serine/threonine protein kinase
LESFEKIRVLGVGGTGIVYELLHKNNGKRYALKEIEIKNAKQREMAISEAGMLKDIMENISHPNILHIEKVFQVGSKFYLVFPLCTGGELYEHIVARGHLTEYDAARITHDLISGLSALHSCGVLHLDIKPENLLFENNNENALIKITDFGISRIFSQASNHNNNMMSPTPSTSVSLPSVVVPRNSIATTTTSTSIAATSTSTVSPNIQGLAGASTIEFLFEKFLERRSIFEKNKFIDFHSIKGTIGYMSPELILMNYSSKAADVFAAGVVVYILLCGRPPFGGENDQIVLLNTVRGNYNKTNSRYYAISEEARDLIDKMLKLNPLERITCEEILEHPWIQQVIQLQQQQQQQQQQQLSQLQQESRQSSQSGLQSEIDGVLPSASSSSSSFQQTKNLSIHSPITPTKPISLRGASDNSPNHPRTPLTNNDLGESVKALSKHVSKMRSQKMATNLTRLISFMGKNQTASSLSDKSSKSDHNNNNNRHISLTEKYLKPKKVVISTSSDQLLSPPVAPSPVAPLTLKETTETSQSSLSRSHSSLSSAATTAASSSSIPSGLSPLPPSLTAPDRLPIPQTEKQDREEELMILLNKDLRDAMSNVFLKLNSASASSGNTAASVDRSGGGGGEEEENHSHDLTNSTTLGLTIEQFLIILHHFHFTPTPPSPSPGNHPVSSTIQRTNVAAILFCR